MERPTIHCFIARRKANGRVRSVRRVSLQAAYLAMKDGWIVVGPDPQDMQTYERWLTARQPFNRPHSS